MNSRFPQSASLFQILNMNFYAKLENAMAKTHSLVCVGLDPDFEKLPTHLRADPFPFFAFNKALIDATADIACAFKPQFAHYAGQGRLADLERTFAYLRERAPHAVGILDSKRGDIGSTAAYYAQEAFVVYGADAVTVNPYMGGDTLEPFTRYADKGVIVLCKTSNPGSDELQGLEIGGRPLYQHVAEKAATAWNQNRNLALVVGATFPNEIGAVRRLAPELPLLVPGIGAQGGDLEATLRQGLNGEKAGVMINSSRGIIYADNGPDFAERARQACLDLRGSINQYRMV